jgi:hypothetical protein
MSRRNQGPRLRWLDKRQCFYITWTELGRSRECSTGTAEGERAEIVFAEFLQARRRRDGPSDPSAILVTEVLNDYLKERGPKVATPGRIAYAVLALTDFFEGNMVADVTPQTCSRYVDKRGRSKGIVRRELAERTALVDRLKLVLDKWELKGGDPKPYRLYIASIGGIKIDVSDRAATWERIKAWLSADEGGLRFARDLATFFGYILGSIVVAWIVRMILRRVMSASRVTSHLFRDFIIASSGRVIVVIGVLLALSALEVNLAPLLAVIGAAGFVVAFALQGTLSNLASGLLVMVFKPFDVGDEVEVAGGIKGKVTAMTIFSTYIQTDDGIKKIVPNDNIWKNVIINQTTGVVKTPTGAEPSPSEAKPATG